MASVLSEDRCSWRKLLPGVFSFASPNHYSRAPSLHLIASQLSLLSLSNVFLRDHIME